MDSGDFPIGPTEFSLAAQICRAAGHPLMLKGPPGVGKSSSVRAYVRAVGHEVAVVLASIREPSDFAGLPVIVSNDDEGACVNLAPPGWVFDLAKWAHNGGAVLFLDEVNLASPATQGALLRVVLERVVGEVALPDAVWVVAAMNDVEHSAGGYDLAQSFADRFCQVDFRLTVDEYCSGLLANWADVAPPAVPEDWRDRLPEAKAVVSSFLHARPSLLLDVPNDPSVGIAFPTPRSWSMAVDLVAAADAIGADDEITLVLVAGVVGPGAAIEFMDFRENMSLVDPELVLGDPMGVDLPERDDELLAVFGAVVSAATTRPSTERWLAAWRFLDRGAETRPDLAAAAAIALVRNKPDGATMPRVSNLDRSLRRARITR